jgi:acyl-CoA thioesterase FadM
MARVKIELPEKFIFSTEIPLRISDINYGGHLGNDSVLSKDVAGAGIIMVDAAVQYNAEGFYGDVLIIELGIKDITKTGCDIVYQLTNKKSGKSVAIVKTGVVFFDYQKRKVVPIPEVFLSVIKE